jgi:hypothetical protein
VTSQNEEASHPESHVSTTWRRGTRTISAMPAAGSGRWWTVSTAIAASADRSDSGRPRFFRRVTGRSSIHSSLLFAHPSLARPNCAPRHCARRDEVSPHCLDNIRTLPAPDRASGRFEWVVFGRTLIVPWPGAARSSSRFHEMSRGSMSALRSRTVHRRSSVDSTDPNPAEVDYVSRPPGPAGGRHTTPPRPMVTTRRPCVHIRS